MSSATQAQDAPRLEPQEAKIVGSFAEAAPQLRAPFTPEAIRWKVQTVFGGASGAILVAYIDARLVIERLNAVVPGIWQDRYERVPGQEKHLLCHLTVGELTRTDVGEWAQGFGKAMFSDALKRAAVHFGVGVSVYAVPQVTAYAKDAIPQGKLKPKKVNGKDSLVLTPFGERALRDGYRVWLESRGIERFGKPLDHGDVEDSAAMDTDSGAPAVESGGGDEAPARLEGPGADERIAAVQGVYDSVVEARGRSVLPPAAFRAKLEAAWGSLEGLDRLFEELSVMAGAES